MKTLFHITLIIGASFFMSSYTHLEKNDLVGTKKSTETHTSITNDDSKKIVDTEILNDFFKRHIELKKYQKEVTALYKNRSYGAIWYNGNKINEFGYLLHQKLNLTHQEGLTLEIPYKEKIDQIFDTKTAEKPSQLDADVLLSASYVIYMSNVYEGIDGETVKKTGWNLPKKKISYETLLDSLLTNPKLLEKNNDLLFNQYYKLQEVLTKYQKIEKEKTWTPITFATPYKDLRPDANCETIGQVRTRLVLMGDMKNDNKSTIYDQELMDGVMKYKVRNGLKPNYIITMDHIKDLNITIEERIKTLQLNMERCRWVSPKLINDTEYIMVNIPSYELVYMRDGKRELVSNVFVGSTLNKTTIFNGEIDKIVFSPYWYLPQSIIENELKLKIAADKNYLTDHNMEWYNGQLRQKPGKDNSLGLVKFIFPNPDDIYMHDSPAKSLFDFERRAFSHGCVNVKKAKELAVAILKGYPEWTPEKIDQAMDGTTETTFKLPKKVPIYIGYFTAWVNDSGEISFYEDVYQRDNDLNKVLFQENATTQL